MKKYRYRVSFSLTMLLYVGLFSLYFYLLNQHITVSDTPKENAIELSLSQFVPEVPPLATEVPVQEEQLVEEEPEPQPEEMEEKAPEAPLVEEKEPEPEPVAKETPVAESVVKKELKRPKKKVAQKKPAKKRVVKKKKPHRKRQLSGGGLPRYSAGARNRFLAQIRKKIDRAKSYPRIAQRRGMQGTVKVRFTILANGHVGHIVLSGPTVFHASVRKAVQSAFPVDVKKAPLRLPKTVNLSLRYTLR